MRIALHHSSPVAQLKTPVTVRLNPDLLAEVRQSAARDNRSLVLSDVMMPGGMDGMALVREMRQRKISLPVVLVSGFSAAAKRDAEHAGVPLLPKPYNLGDLAAQLNSALASPGSR